LRASRLHGCTSHHMAAPVGHGATTGGTRGEEGARDAAGVAPVVETFPAPSALRASEARTRRQGAQSPALPAPQSTAPRGANSAAVHISIFDLSPCGPLDSLSTGLITYRAAAGAARRGPGAPGHRGPAESTHNPLALHCHGAARYSAGESPRRSHEGMRGGTRAGLFHGTGRQWRRRKVILAAAQTCGAQPARPQPHRGTARRAARAALECVLASSLGNPTAFTAISGSCGLESRPLT
jgi:hypothetical protein